MSLLREEDTFGRIGGEEFLIIIPLNTLNKTVKLAERVLNKIEKLDFTDEGIQKAITVSAGVAKFDDCYSDELSLLNNADIALYQAKNAGRNCIKVFSR